MATIPVEIELRGVDRLTKTINGSTNALENLDQKTKKAERGMKRFGRSSVGVMAKTRLGVSRLTAGVSGLAGSLGIGGGLGGLGLAAGLGAATKSAIDFETGLVKVGKTTDIQGKELEALGKRFETLSTEIPVSIQSLLQLGETAGTLGVQGSDNLVKFVDTFAKLQTASNITGEQGAQDIAIILNLLEGGVQNVDRFSSSLVMLGNNVAANESQILGVTTELAKVFAQYNTTTDSVVGLAAAFKTSGVEAEVARTASLKILDTIGKLSEKGGPKLKAFNKLLKNAGVENADLAKTLEKDAVGAVKLFVTALKQFEVEGGKSDKILEDLGLTEVRTRTATNALKANIDSLTKSLQLSAQGTNENTALQKEFEQQNKTTAASLQKSINRIETSARRIGIAIAPILASLTSQLAKLTEDFFKLPQIAEDVAVPLLTDDSVKKLGGKTQLLNDLIAVKKAEQNGAGQAQIEVLKKRALKQAALIRFADSKENFDFVPDSLKAQMPPRITQLLERESSEKEKTKQSALQTSSRFSKTERIGKIDGTTKEQKEVKATIKIEGLPAGATVTQDNAFSDKDFNIQVSRGAAGGL